MNNLFSDWLRQSGLNVQDRPLAEWWEGLEIYCSGMNRSTLGALLRFAIAKKPTEKDVPTGFREALKDKDEAFPMRENLFELQQLAISTLRNLYDAAEVTDDQACTAALGIICGAFGRNPGPTYMEHAQKASEFLAHSADELRIRKEPKLSSDTTADIEKNLSNTKDFNEFKNLAAPITSSMLSSLNILTRRLRLQEEEINMLWWLFGEYSRERKSHFRDLGAGEAAIVAAKELADLTTFPPGPVSFEGILCKALAPDTLDRKINLAEVINSLNREWRASIAESVKSLVNEMTVCPLHLMIMKALEADSDKDWPVLFRAACDVSTSLKVAPRAISVQFYYERMYLDSLEYLN
jgi:hypothetical protein